MGRVEGEDRIHAHIHTHTYTHTHSHTHTHTLTLTHRRVTRCSNISTVTHTHERRAHTQTCDQMV